MFLYAADLTALGLPTTVENVATVSDTAAPALAAFNIDTPVVSASNGVISIDLSLTVTDDLGLHTNQFFFDGSVTLMSPSGTQFTGASLSSTFEQSGSTPTNRSYTTTAQILEGSETGDWVVTTISLVDRVGNRVFLYTADLTAAGFPTVVTVQ